MLTKEKIEEIRSYLGFNRYSKVLNVTHAGCLDGVGCSITINNCFEDVKFINATYSNIDEILTKVEYDKYDVVFVTDVSPKDKRNLQISDNIILLDHHDSALMHHDPENFKFVNSGESASLFVKDLFEKYFKTDLSYIDELIMYINDYDMWRHKYKKSKQLNELFFKYWNENFLKRFSAGNVEFSKEEKEFIKKRRKMFENTFENTTYNDLDKIKGCLFQVEDFVNDVCDRLLTEHDYKITINRNPRSGNCSIRTSLKEDGFHLGDTLKKLEFGGGHESAGGLWEPDAIKFRKKIMALEKIIYDECPSARNY